jgi:hypothetical protein
MPHARLEHERRVSWAAIKLISPNSATAGPWAPTPLAAPLTTPGPSRSGLGWGSGLLGTDASAATERCPRRAGELETRARGRAFDS